jgi:hypothetical protein
VLICLPSRTVTADHRHQAVILPLRSQREVGGEVAFVDRSSMQRISKRVFADERIALSSDGSCQQMASMPESSLRQSDGARLI